MAPGKRTRRSKKSQEFSLKAALSCFQVTALNTQRLNLSCRDFDSIPKCIEELTGFQEVDLSRNRIREIPAFTTNFLSVTVLDLHSNQLESLPSSLGILQNLLVLNLCNNLLRSLPGELGQLKTLRTLNLGLNQLDALPASVVGLKELRYIGLSDNRFTHFPGCLHRLNKLEKVNMARNPIWTRQNPEAAPETFLLVRSSLLCGRCLERCQSFRRRMKNEEKGGVESCFLRDSDDSVAPPADPHTTLQ
ncbi:leucine-rich repeat-containing protein 18 [Oryzias melastigma]|uniref:Leucine rich repeat containing 18b n=1 Tax=Oryzias melastigma TaxID=30732 RepID=A0A3B3DCG4_ORYME|nr:leucine-rich repeat-containing protein 18 [Oryzias melastigma]